MFSSVSAKRSAYYSFAKFTMLSSAVFFAGCQRIPDQQQVTKLSVPDIVKNVRCEIKRALVGRYAEPVITEDQKLEGGDWIYRATVTYTFEFTTEINNDLDLAFNGIWNKFRRVGRRSRVRITSNNSGDFDHKREGLDTFAANESLSNLIRLSCPEEDNRRYLRYPIKGNIGIEKVVDEFFETVNNPFFLVTQHQKLLRFTVLKGGSLNPMYFISPVPLDIRTLDFPLTLAVNRKDIHSVTLNFVLPAVYQPLVDNWTPEKTPKPVTLVRIVGGEKKTKDGKVIEVCKEDKNDKNKKVCTKHFPSELSIVPAVVPPEGTVAFPAFKMQGNVPIITPDPGKKLIYKADGATIDQETYLNAKPVTATKAQGDSRALSPSIRRKLEENQTNERIISSDALRTTR